MLSALRQFLYAALALLLVGLYIAIPHPAGAATDWTSINSGTTANLNGIWGTSPSDYYLCGDNGLVLHYNGSTCSAMSTSTTRNLYRIWGTSNSDIFAVGIGTIIHYNGAAWSTQTSSVGPLLGIWGSSSSDVFAVGFAGAIEHYNGSTWSSMTSGTSEHLGAVWGTSGTNVYAVGYNGTILHYNGSSWSPMTSGVTTHLSAIWGFSSSDIYAGGYMGILLHYNGTAWSTMTNISGGWISQLWGSSPSNLFAAGGQNVLYRYNGSSWNATTTDIASKNYYGVWGTSAYDIFAAGESGAFLRFNTNCCPTSAQLNTTLGTVMLSASGCCINNASLYTTANLPCSAPATCIFPYGMFSFDTGPIASGQTGRITIQFPNTIPATTRLYICEGATMADLSSIVSRIDDRTLLLTLSSGGTHVIGACFASVITPQSSSPWLPEASKAPVQLSNISVKSASLSTTKVTPGTPVTVTANLANTGTGNGASVVKVYVNGAEDASQGVTVNSGGTSTISFDVTRNQPGTYTVYVGGTNAGSFTVDEFTPDTILFISGALVFFSLVIGVIYMTGRRSRA